jgi:hypothetical protein
MTAHSTTGSPMSALSTSIGETLDTADLEHVVGAPGASTALLVHKGIYRP